MDVVEALHRAREAYQRREWLTAYETLSDLENTALTAADFITLGDTAELSGHANDAIQAWQRAHNAAIRAAEPLLAIRAAARLAMMLALRGETAISGGWLAAGQRLLDEINDDVVEHGYLLTGRLFERISVGDIDGAALLPPQILEYARRHDDANLLAMGLNQQGRLLSVAGHVSEGVRLLDEAMTGVVAGQVDGPLFAGEVYCSMIEGCQWVGDWGRAAQWTRALTIWCDEQLGLVAFIGNCAVHRAQLMRFNGAFIEAVDELERAVQGYTAAGNYRAIALAYTERGDVLRLLGDLDAAEQAYSDAIGHGADAQPGRALLQMSRGEVRQAAVTARRLLETTAGAAFRLRLIPGSMQVLLAAGSIDEVTELTAELSDIAEQFGSVAVRAAAEYAMAQTALAQRNPSSALTSAKSALRYWLQLNASYEVARARVQIGQALAMLGDDEEAAVELRTALRAFESQGAVSDAHHVLELLGEGVRPKGLTEREVEVLRLVALGRSNAQIAGDLHLSIKTVARHLSNIFTKFDVSSRTQAVAVARQHDLV